jgi:GntR family transcriptional regulator of vanillate catabolism
MSQTTTQILTKKLRNLILEGDLKAGERLQETRVAKLIGSSRTPARIALRALASEGLLTYTPNCGYEIYKITLDRVMAAYELRAELESLACSIVAKKGLTNKTKATLQSCLTTGDEILSGCALREEDRECYREMNRTFHETIVHSSGNELLATFVRQASNIPFASNRMVIWDDYFVIKRSHDDHHRIVHALIEQDPMRVKALMWEHIRFASEYVRNDLMNTSSSLVSMVQRSTNTPV